jgi:hypothetical protein
VKLHHVGVGVRKRQRRSDAAGGADGADQIGVVVALISGLPGPRSATDPLADETVFLTDPSLVFKPDFDRRRLRQSFETSLQRAREVLWNGPPLPAP